MATSSVDSIDLGISGLASGFDWKSFVDQMVTVERAPQTTMKDEQTAIDQRNQARFGAFLEQLSAELFIRS